MGLLADGESFAANWRKGCARKVPERHEVKEEEQQGNDC